MRLLFSLLLLLGTTFLTAEKQNFTYDSYDLGPPNEILIKGFYSGEWWNPLPDCIEKQIVGNSWKEDCPVPLEDLAYVQITHWNMDGELFLGELIYHKNLAHEIVEIFLELFEAGFPIERMILIDDYDADDNLSMIDNNSSAFCSRAITGKPGVFSMHSYGGTIDINPFLNPYVKGDTILPPGAEPYLDRTAEVPGMIKENGPCYQAFFKRGYAWGGHWHSLKDYQHFEKRPEQFIFEDKE